MGTILIDRYDGELFIFSDCSLLKSEYYVTDREIEALNKGSAEVYENMNLFDKVTYLLNKDVELPVVIGDAKELLLTAYTQMRPQRATSREDFLSFAEISFDRQRRHAGTVGPIKDTWIVSDNKGGMVIAKFGDEYENLGMASYHVRLLRSRPECDCGRHSEGK